MRKQRGCILLSADTDEDAKIRTATGDLVPAKTIFAASLLFLKNGICPAWSLGSETPSQIEGIRLLKKVCHDLSLSLSMRLCLGRILSIQKKFIGY